jgi:hypothetical protein
MFKLTYVTKRSAKTSKKTFPEKAAILSVRMLEIKLFERELVTDTLRKITGYFYTVDE